MTQTPPKARTRARKGAAQYRRSVNRPVTVDRHTWFYLERNSVEIVRQVRNEDGAIINADIFRIPWRKLLSAHALVRRHFGALPKRARRRGRG